MKPVKKPEGTKKSEKKVDAHKKIPNYFRNIGKPAVEEGTLTEFQDTKPIYVDALKTALKGHVNATRSSPFEKEQVLQRVEQDISSMPIEGVEDQVVSSLDVGVDGKVADAPSQCAQCKAKDQQYNELLKKYLKSTHRYSELDFKYKDLVQAKARLNELQLVDQAAASSSNDVFTANEVKYLKAMPIDKSTDSTFVLKCLEFAYKNDPSVMRNKTLFGTLESVVYNADGGSVTQPKKDPLTPAKVHRIKELFIERLNACQLDSVTFGERIRDANVNKLFASGILNMAKKKR